MLWNGELRWVYLDIFEGWIQDMGVFASGWFGVWQMDSIGLGQWMDGWMGKRYIAQHRWVARDIHIREFSEVEF